MINERYKWYVPLFSVSVSCEINSKNSIFTWIFFFSLIWSHLRLSIMPRTKNQMRTILCIRVMNRIGSFKKTSSNLLLASEIRTTLFFTPRGGSVTHYCCLVISKPFLCRITMGENNQMLAEWQKCLFPLTHSVEIWEFSYNSDFTWNQIQRK